MSIFSKYIEFHDGSIVVFSPDFSHESVCSRVGKVPLSGGLASFPYHGRGKFFGAVKSLGLRARTKINISATSFWGAVCVETSGKRHLFVSTAHDNMEKLSLSAKLSPMIEFQDTNGTKAFIPNISDAMTYELSRFSGVLD